MGRLRLLWRLTYATHITLVLHPRLSPLSMLIIAIKTFRGRCQHSPVGACGGPCHTVYEGTIPIISTAYRRCFRSLGWQGHHIQLSWPWAHQILYIVRAWTRLRAIHIVFSSV